MEVLSDILRSLRIEGSVYFCDLLEAPWSKEFSEAESASFHLVKRGLCYAEIGERTEQLGPGDLIFLGPGVEHRLFNKRDSDEDLQSVDSTLLLCGYCKFITDRKTPLLDVFPETVIIRQEEIVQHPWLKSTFEQLSSEFMSQSPGSELIVNRLTEIVLIELVRINFGSDSNNTFLQALHDKSISSALRLIHGDIKQSWTLDVLADRVALSRAAFAKRFKQLVGQPMFQYLTGLRMQKASELLLDTKLPVVEIAEQVGYESDLAFVRVFKKFYEVTPTKYRAQRTN